MKLDLGIVFRKYETASTAVPARWLQGTGIDLINVSPGPFPGEQQSPGLLHLEWFDSRTLSLLQIRTAPRWGAVLICVRATKSSVSWGKKDQK